MTKREAILREFVTRAEAIRQANGYETDAGAALTWGETPMLGDRDPDEAIVIVPGETAVTYQQAKVWITLPVHLQAVAKVRLDQWVAAYLRTEQILGDLKRAIEIDHTLGGLVHVHDFQRGTERTLQREEGDTVVGVAITWAVRYQESWGDPDAGQPAAEQS